MKNKLTMNAPGVSELRNEGMHQTLMRSIDMGSGLEDQAERKNLMIYADINDKLRRDILVRINSYRLILLRLISVSLRKTPFMRLKLKLRMKMFFVKESL